jgi:hypothetical protein
VGKNVPPSAGSAKDWEPRDEPVRLPLNQGCGRQILAEDLDGIETTIDEREQLTAPVLADVPRVYHLAVW